MISPESKVTMHTMISTAREGQKLGWKLRRIHRLLAIYFAGYIPIVLLNLWADPFPYSIAWWVLLPLSVFMLVFNIKLTEQRLRDVEYWMCVGSYANEVLNAPNETRLHCSVEQLDALLHTRGGSINIREAIQS